MIYLRLLTGLGLIALALSYSGRWLAFGDSLAVGRLHLLLAGLAVAVALRLTGERGLFRLTLLAVLVSGAQTFWLWRGPANGEPGDFTLYQKNLLFLNSEHPEIIADIRDSFAEVVTLQEVAERNFPVLEGLKDIYPYQHYCPFGGVGGVAILSQVPLVGGSMSCGDKDGLALAQVVVAGKGPVWIASIHLHWPWPYAQRGQVLRILPRLEALEGPVVIGGDFNMQGWGASVGMLARATDTARLGGYGATFSRFATFAPLVIDQVLVPRGASGQIARRPLLGSDHMGLLADIRL